MLTNHEIDNIISILGLQYVRERLQLYGKGKEVLEGILQGQADSLAGQARLILQKIDGTIVIGKVSPHLFCVSRFLKKLHHWVIF